MKQRFLAFLRPLFVTLGMIPLASLAQQRVVISPFFSDYSVLTDSLPKGWSISPYIQLGVKVIFPQGTTPAELQQYQFQNPLLLVTSFGNFNLSCCNMGRSGGKI